MSIAERLRTVRERVEAACAASGRSADEVSLLAVSKRQPSFAVCEALAAGQRMFGENRVQELVAKDRELSEQAEIRWHMIGSLQTNKVKDLLGVGRLELLHSLDRRRLADELQRQLDGVGRDLETLLQVHATGEENKHGCLPCDAPALVEHVLANCPRIHLVGLMAMGPLGADPVPVFGTVADLRADLRDRFRIDLPVLSLGMTNDLEAAVAAGSTLVRVGTGVFGPRG